MNKLSKKNAETMNKVMSTASASNPHQHKKPNRAERRKHPEVKINKPFSALAGFKIGIK